jgi:allophanate hydrolase subunit 2
MLDFSMINTPSLWVDRHRHMVGHMAVTLSGPIDELSFRHNEYLLGAYGQVQLESRGGLRFTASKPVSLCVTGAKVEVKVAQKSFSSYEIIPILPNQTVTIGIPNQGKIIYLGFTTQFSLPKILGSVCSVGREEFGGEYQDGRMLRAPYSCAMVKPTVLPHNKTNFTPFWQTYFEPKLTVIPAYQYAQFDVVNRMKFISIPYTISSHADRMGYRLLSDTPLSAPIINESQPIALGAIQIPQDGMPIVLLADKQTTGGYPIIGCLSQLGIVQLVQMSGPIEFDWITPEGALANWRSHLMQDKAVLESGI